VVLGIIVGKAYRLREFYLKVDRVSLFYKALRITVGVAGINALYPGIGDIRKDDSHVAYITVTVITVFKSSSYTDSQRQIIKVYRSELHISETFSRGAVRAEFKPGDILSVLA
jgi:hypothetical protein